MNANVCVFFNDTATTEIYTLSLHDALPICVVVALTSASGPGRALFATGIWASAQSDVIGPITPMTLGLSTYSFAASSHLLGSDRKSTRLNSSHANISYAVFCLKKKKQMTVC